MSRSILLSAALLLSLSACADMPLGPSEPYAQRDDRLDRERTGTFHGGDPRGFVIYSSKDSEAAEGAAAAPPASALRTVGVDADLWRASLETLDVMPLAQADSQGGVIVTEWHAQPETPDERRKVTVYLLDDELVADAVKVTVFRQTESDGQWIDAGADADAAGEIKADILRRVEELQEPPAATGRS